MTTLMILIREPNGDGVAARTLNPLLCPYLSTFGGSAKLLSDRRFREPSGDERAAPVAVLDVELSGSANADLQTIVAKLHRFLKQTAKDAGLAATFEVLQPDGTPTRSP